MEILYLTACPGNTTSHHRAQPNGSLFFSRTSKPFWYLTSLLLLLMENTIGCHVAIPLSMRLRLQVDTKRIKYKGPKKMQKHTTGGIPRWSPTLVLVARFSAYVWQSGRDAQFSLTYGRMYQL